MRIVIDDFKLPSWNIFYAGKHWHVRKQKADELHQLISYHCYQNKIMGPIKNKVKIHFEIHYKDKRRHDPDNACIKPLIDGLVLIGILKDDSTKEISEIKIKMKVSQKTNQVIMDII